MQDKYYVGAYWGPRKETALECARRAELFFHMLARCDPSFAQWYRAGRGFPRELPGSPVRPEVKELEKFFLRAGTARMSARRSSRIWASARSCGMRRRSATDVHLSLRQILPVGWPQHLPAQPARGGRGTGAATARPGAGRGAHVHGHGVGPRLRHGQLLEMVDLIEKRKVGGPGGLADVPVAPPGHAAAAARARAHRAGGKAGLAPRPLPRAHDGEQPRARGLHRPHPRAARPGRSHRAATTRARQRVTSGPAQSKGMMDSFAPAGASSSSLAFAGR